MKIELTDFQIHYIRTNLYFANALCYAKKFPKKSNKDVDELKEMFNKLDDKIKK